MAGKQCGHSEAAPTMLLGVTPDFLSVPTPQGRDSHNSAGASEEQRTILKNPRASKTCVYISLDTT